MAAGNRAHMRCASGLPRHVWSKLLTHQICVRNLPCSARTQVLHLRLPVGSFFGSWGRACHTRRAWARDARLLTSCVHVRVCMPPGEPDFSASRAVPYFSCSASFAGAVVATALLVGHGAEPDVTQQSWNACFLGSYDHSGGFKLCFCADRRVSSTPCLVFPFFSSHRVSADTVFFGERERRRRKRRSAQWTAATNARRASGSGGVWWCKEVKSAAWRWER